MAVQELDQVLTAVGSTCSPLMIYILPALFCLAPVARRGGGGCGAACTRRTCPTATMLVYGCVLVPVCLSVWAMRYFVCIDTLKHGSAVCAAFGF